MENAKRGKHGQVNFSCQSSMDCAIASILPQLILKIGGPKLIKFMSPTCLISELPTDLIFVSDSPEVNLIKETLGEKSNDFSSFFVRVGEGEYLDIFGVYGIIPDLMKPAFKLL
jgi:hypothetical protein